MLTELRLEWKGWGKQPPILGKILPWDGGGGGRDPLIDQWLRQAKPRSQQNKLKMVYVLEGSRNYTTRHGSDCAPDRTLLVDPMFLAPVVSFAR
jgi:hypothetical protein